MPRGLAVHLGADNAMRRPCANRSSRLPPALFVLGLPPPIPWSATSTVSRSEPMESSSISPSADDRRRREGSTGARASRAGAPGRYHEPRRRRRPDFASGPDRRPRSRHGTWPIGAPARSRRDHVARRPAAAAPRPMPRRIAKRPVDHRPRLEPGAVVGQALPDRADLDAVVADRPVMLERVDGHAIVVNSAALKAAGVTSATKDPVGGKIERMPTAALRACSSMRRPNSSSKVVPAPTNAEARRSARQGTGNPPCLSA